MDARALLDALHVAERLKDETRHCYTSGGLTAGDGITAELLRQNGIAVYGESEIGRLLEEHGCPEPGQTALF